MMEKLGSLVTDIQAEFLTPEDGEILAHPLVGGVILFARNYSSKDQLKSLCHSIRKVRKTPMIIMVDQEGGRVQRFIHEFTRLPYMGEFGKIYNSNPEKAYTLASNCGWLIATEILSVGIDLSLVPVLDVNKGLNTVIGERAFHENPQVVLTLAKAFMEGMKKAGMAATGKHFPGHGSVTSDSHLATPMDNRKFAEIVNTDLIPFAGLVKAGIPAMMTSHIIFPEVDSVPVSFSRTWLKTILRKQLNFHGTILSDDTNMQGANISENHIDRFHAARLAGCDFVLLCNNRPATIKVLESVKYESHQLNQEQWRPLVGDFLNISEHLQTNSLWLKTNEFLQGLSSS